MVGTGSAAQRYAALTVDALADALRELPGWTVDHGHLKRVVAAADPWRLLERVQEVEEQLEHHSLVALDRGLVVFEVWTHVRSSLTAADVQLAHRIDEAAAESEAQTGS